MEQKFELFMGCLGNGITLANKAVEENNDYKIIGHISEGGNIKLYVDETYILEEDMTKIKNVAQQTQKKFRENFERQDIYKQYFTILDFLPIRKLLYYSDDRPLEEKLPEMREYYYGIK